MPYFKGDLEVLQKFCRAQRLTLASPHIHGTRLQDFQAHGVALLLREEHLTPYAPPGSAVKLQVPDPWENAPRTPDTEPFDMRALDTAIQGGILMHQLKQRM
ncbi:unnamed protein product [Durusdinium trenchii]|uniref:Uncharacterized protein n=1 Tax=Durusdinium trenchii TaxID=1381693 RepID=A0ABP0NJR6_9DINO